MERHRDERHDSKKIDPRREIRETKTVINLENLEETDISKEKSNYPYL